MVDADKNRFALYTYLGATRATRATGATEGATGATEGATDATEGATDATEGATGATPSNSLENSGKGR